MAATVLTAVPTTLMLGLLKVVVTIPTTVDGGSGATCDFQLPRAYAICLQTQSTNYNGKTVALQGAPDGSNYAALPTAKSTGSNAVLSVATADTAMLNYRITIDGAPTAAVTVTILATQWR